MKKGDRIFYYHTGKQRAIVGVARALDSAYPDPKDTSGRSAVVDIAPVKKLPTPVSLAEIKADRFFEAFPLVRSSRLSVMPVTDEEWADYVYLAENVCGPQNEWWFHTKGCGCWFTVTRDTRTNLPVTCEEEKA